MYCLIDLSQYNIIKLALFDEDRKVEFVQEGMNKDLLVSIDTFFARENFDKKDIQGIAAVVGEGGFTSTRIATTVANSFAFAFDCPVLAITKGESDDTTNICKRFKDSKLPKYISAVYSGEPNIN